MLFSVAQTRRGSRAREIVEIYSGAERRSTGTSTSSDNKSRVVSDEWSESMSLLLRSAFVAVICFVFIRFCPMPKTGVYLITSPKCSEPGTNESSSLRSRTHMAMVTCRHTSLLHRPQRNIVTKELNYCMEKTKCHV